MVWPIFDLLHPPLRPVYVAELGKGYSTEGVPCCRVVPHDPHIHGFRQPSLTIPLDELEVWKLHNDSCEPYGFNPQHNVLQHALHAHTYTQMRACVRACTHARARSRSHTHTHTTHAHTRTCTSTQAHI